MVLAFSLLMPIWLALVLAVLAATGSTSESPILGEWSAPFLAVGAGLIFLLALDSLVLARRSAAQRLSTNRSAAPERTRMLPRPVRLLALGATALALAAGVIGLVAPSAAEPTQIYATINGVTLESPITRGSYLARMALPTTGIEAEDLRERGVMINLTTELATPSDVSIDVRGTVVDAKTQDIVGGKDELFFSLRSELGNQRRSASESVNARQLLLLQDRQRPPPTAGCTTRHRPVVPLDADSKSRCLLCSDQSPLCPRRAAERGSAGRGQNTAIRVAMSLSK